MKLTEEKLKQIILETLEKKSLPHLEKITTLFSKSYKDGMQAASFLEALDEYKVENIRTKKHSPALSSFFYDIIIVFEKSKLGETQAEQLYKSLDPKFNSGGLNRTGRVMFFKNEVDIRYEVKKT